MQTSSAYKLVIFKTFHPDMVVLKKKKRQAIKDLRETKESTDGRVPYREKYILHSIMDMKSDQ
jgi:hypothetical protein